MSEQQVQLASYQQAIGFFSSWKDYVQTQTERVSMAVSKGARWLVFPEYGAMELASLLDEQTRTDIRLQLSAIQQFLIDFIGLHQRLADQFNVLIIAPSLPVAVAGEFRNRTYLFRPQRAVEFQEKLMMTRFECELWGVSAGGELKIFEFEGVKFAITICYDCEFPLLARAASEAGAVILFVPSCTDTMAGYHRVRVGAQARALENQCYVVQSCTVGEAVWSAAVDENHGAAGVYTAPDYGWPDNGVLMQGEVDAAQAVFATLDMAHLQWVRKQGQVLNVHDWPESSLNRITLVLPDDAK